VHKSGHRQPGKSGQRTTLMKEKAVGAVPTGAVEDANEKVLTSTDVSLKLRFVNSTG
jgi:hypothetical protein